MRVYGHFPDSSLERRLRFNDARVSGVEAILGFVGFASFLGLIFVFCMRGFNSSLVVGLFVAAILGFGFAVFLHHRRVSTYVVDLLSDLKSSDECYESVARCLYGEDLEKYVGPRITRFSRNGLGDYVDMRETRIGHGNENNPYEYVVHTVLMKYPLSNGRFGYISYKARRAEVECPGRISFDVLYALDENGDVCFLVCDLDNVFEILHVSFDSWFATSDV